MANFVTNIVHFDGDPERILDLRGTVQDDQYGMSGIDFNKIIPMPSGLWMGGINPGTRFRFGKNNWLDWSLANWGTKWNAFRFDDNPDHYSDSKITFVTADTAPAPIMQKLSEMYPEIMMHHLWADDNVGHNCGERIYKAGAVIMEFKPEPGVQAVDYACKIMGTTPADHCLKLNEDGTEYILFNHDEGGEKADFSGCRLTNLDMRHMQLNGADFTGALLEGVRMNDAGLCFCTFRDAKLVGCNLNGAIAEESDFCGATFTECKMRNGIFTHSNFAHTSFQDTDLWISSFASCCIENSSIMDTETEGVNLSGTIEDEQGWVMGGM